MGTSILILTNSESTMRVLVHLIVAVLICGCFALKDQPEGEIQQDGSSDRSWCWSTFDTKRPRKRIFCEGGCGKSWPDNYNWCHIRRERTLFGVVLWTWDYCTC